MLFGRACLKGWKALLKQGTDSSLFQAQFARLKPEQREAFERSDYRKFYDEAELVYVPGTSTLKVEEDKDNLKKRADNCNNETGVVSDLIRAGTIIPYPFEGGVEADAVHAGEAVWIDRRCHLERHHLPVGIVRYSGR